MAAAIRGHRETAEVLLAAGASVEARDGMGNTPLILAAAGVLQEAGGHPAVVRLLLDNGSEIDASNNDGVTALIIAATRGSLETVRLLLDAGADRDAEILFGGDQGETALSLSLRNNHEDVVRLLRDRGDTGGASQTGRVSAFDKMNRLPYA
jgi:ankyrin repeat protein